MSRYYNQLRGDYKASPEAAAVATPPAPSEPVSIPEPATGERRSERFRECEKLCIAASPGAPLILGNENGFSSAADSYRALRTRLVRLLAAKQLRSVVISSPVPAEGKTLTTMNLGLTFARLEKQRVLLVDGDLRTSGLSRLFEAQDGPGLTDILQGEATFDSTVRSTDVPNLYVVTAGGHSAGTAEAFATDRWKEFMAWATESFDVVLVDSPPILAMADFELIAASCDSTLLVVRALHTGRETLAKAVKLVDAKKFLGLVFNRSNPRSETGYYGYGAYGNAAR
jgi:capsular exopolysaccharide synthesis family protein